MYFLVELWSSGVSRSHASGLFFILPAHVGLTPIVQCGLEMVKFAVRCQSSMIMIFDLRSSCLGDLLTVAAAYWNFIFFFLFFFFFVFFFFFFSKEFFLLGLHPWHMEVLKPGVKSELQLPAYTTATATQDLSHICDLYHSSWQCQIVNPPIEARNRTCILMPTSRIHYRWAIKGTHAHHNFYAEISSL